jgi:hypothetical protein
MRERDRKSETLDDCDNPDLLETDQVTARDELEGADVEIEE